MKKQLIIMSVLYSVSFLNIQAQSQLTILPGSPSSARLGINQFAPNNRLEINSFTGDPYFGTANGSSGLRFTNLTSASTAFPDSLNKVLSVDGSGNVILVTDNGSSSLTGADNGLSVSGGNTVQLGGACGSASAAALLNHREIPMAGYNINYTMPALSTSQMIIGNASCTTSLARLTVTSDNLVNVGFFSNSTNSSSATRGIGINNNNSGSGDALGLNSSATSTSGQATGVNSNATSGSSGRATGVNSNTSSGGTTNIAFNGNCSNATVLSMAANLDLEYSSSPINIGHQTDILGGSNASAVNYGSQLLIHNPGTNYGVDAEAYNGTTNYGIYATAYGGTTNWAGYFSGDVNCTGTYYNISDKRFKNNINKLESVTDKINKLNGYTYNFNTEEFKEKHFSKDQQIGLIAQEVKEVFPQLVREDDKGYLAVNYQGMIPVLLEAIKEQQKQIDDLKKLVTANTSVNDQVSRMSVSLSDKDVVVLNQNQPNPFAEQTTISYTIPQNAGTAQLVFYDASGRQIKNIDITTKGLGQLTVYANDLTNGMYSYTLIVDGKIIDTKKMVKQQ